MDTIRIGEILTPGGPEQQARNEEEVRAKIGRAMRRAARRIPFMDEVMAAYYCALDPLTPTRVRGILLAALAYFVLPLDTVPDLLAVVGFTDDVAVLTVALGAVRNHITDAHRAAARRTLAQD